MFLSVRDLEYFLAVVEHGQLGKVASNFDLTPAALSKSIRRLESDLHLRLFDRSGQGMQLTSVGRSIVERVRNICTQHDDALRYAGDVRTGRSGLFRIGVTIGAIDDIVAPALAALQPKRPAMRVQISFGSPDMLMDKLLQGHVDVVVVGSYEMDVEGLERVIIGRHSYSPIVRLGHPLLSRQNLGLGDLRDCLWIGPPQGFGIRRRFQQMLKEAGIELPTAAIEAEVGMGWALPIIRKTDLISYVPTSMVPTLSEYQVCVLPIRELVLQSVASCYLREGAYRSPLLTEFVEHLSVDGIA